MRNLEELLRMPRLMIQNVGADGGFGRMYLDRKKPSKSAVVVFSTGGGWDHVSVSWSNRCPTWEEMCEVKKTFFYPEEVCVEYHPAESEYVNNFPYCLHLWRYQQPGMPMPPAWMVGAKPGQTIKEAMHEGLKAMDGENSQ